MDSTVAVQMNGPGFSFHTAMNSVGNRVLQVFHTFEGTAAHPFERQFSEPALDTIEPAGTRRHEVRVEAGMALEGLHLGCVCVP
jgi:hypothetical protein